MKATKAIMISMLAIFLAGCTNNNCEHLKHEQNSLLCEDCKQEVDHYFKNNKCIRCDKTTVFEWERITDDEKLVQGVDSKGTVKKFSYITKPFTEIAIGASDSNSLITKEAYAYLPYNYDETKQYNVVVLLHGAGDTEGFWFGKNDRYLNYEDDPKVFIDCYKENKNGNITTNVLDYMVEKQMIKDTIIITPTFFDDVSSDRMQSKIETGFVTSNYYKEVKEYLLPAIAEEFSTFAKSSSDSDLIDARDHFAYAGYSLGAIIGLNSIIPNCYDYFASYAFFSGTTGNTAPLINKIDNSDKPLHYFYCGQGECDLMIKDGMEVNYNYILENSKNITSSNSGFTKIYDTGHFYDSFITQLYNALPHLF